MRPLCPIGLVVWVVDVWSTFCPIAVLGWEGFMNPSDGIRVAGISMPGNSIDKLVHGRVAELIDGSSPEVVIVIENPNLRAERSAFQSGTEVSFDEFHLVLLPPQ